MPFFFFFLPSLTDTSNFLLPIKKKQKQINKKLTTPSPQAMFLTQSFQNENDTFFFLLFCKKKSWKYNNIGMEGLLVVEIGLTSRRIQNRIGRYKHCPLYLLQWHNECFCENIDGTKLYNIIRFYNNFTNLVKSDEKASLLWCDYKPVFIFFSASFHQALSLLNHQREQVSQRRAWLRLSLPLTVFQNWVGCKRI